MVKYLEQFGCANVPCTIRYVGCQMTIYIGMAHEISSADTRTHKHTKIHA